jgi:formate dehydrogenase assembly factor FdhD
MRNKGQAAHFSLVVCIMILAMYLLSQLAASVDDTPRTNAIDKLRGKSTHTYQEIDTKPFIISFSTVMGIFILLFLLLQHYAPHQED